MFLNDDNFFKTNYGRSAPAPDEFISVVAHKLSSFADKLDGLTVSRFAVGPSEDPLVLLDNLNNTPVNFHTFMTSNAEYLRANNMGESNRRLIVEGKRRYKLLHFLDKEPVEVSIDHLNYNLYSVQPFGHEHYLMHVGGFSGKDGLKKNAVVVDRSGKITADFYIGDGVEDFQITGDCKVWTGYCDEGVFGDDPIGNLVFGCFDRQGKHLFPSMRNELFEFWCTGINVESDSSVWLAASETGLIQVIDFQVKRVAKKSRGIAKVFAVYEDHVCNAPQMWNQTLAESFVVCHLDTGETKFFKAVDVNVELLKHAHYAGRGSKMYFTANSELYMFDMKEMTL